MACATSPTSRGRSARCAACSRPGGRAVVLDFGKPDNAAARALYRGLLDAMMPAIGWLFHGDPETYLYIPESLERYPAQRGVEKLMQAAGFIERALREPPSARDNGNGCRRRTQSAD